MLRNGSFGVLLLPRMRMRYPALGTQYTASPHLLELYSTTRKASIAFVQLMCNFCAELCRATRELLRSVRRCRSGLRPDWSSAPCLALPRDSCDFPWQAYSFAMHSFSC